MAAGGEIYGGKIPHGAGPPRPAAFKGPGTGGGTGLTGLAVCPSDTLILAQVSVLLWN